MSKNLKWIGFAGLLLLVIVTVLVVLTGESLQQELEKIDQFYQAGEKATTISERKKAFNQALEGYLMLEVAYHPIYGNGKLYYNLGNTYFQLGEYPLAILYYEKALNLLSDPSKAQANLKVTRDKLGIQTDSHPNVFRYLVFFQDWLLPTRLQLLALFLILLLTCLSVWVWVPFSWIKPLSWGTTAIILILLCSVLYSRFFSPAEGIITQPAFLFRDAGMQYAKVQEEPLIGGSKVEVLGLNHASWLKIVTAKGEVGYIKAADIQLIDPYR